ncbi:phage baseplate assembly protein V [Sorangium sp. So ce542]|uniref:phage baseplate assembly protein V n=1 Tax=Sorangium sp. So ce542 TaxID=3133316 RepID=UPI003F5E0795
MDGFLDALFGRDAERHPERFGIAPGIVTNNVDLLGEGRVQVRIPALPNFEPWARVASVGGGSGRGFVWLPQTDDEVLVAFAQNDPNAAYILGGLWSTRDRPPLTNPVDFVTTRLIRTGLNNVPVAHEIKFDDAQQTITITTSTQQKVTLSPQAIEISGTGGAVQIKLDTSTQSISLVAPAKIELQAAQISLKGAQVSIEGNANVNVTANGPCVVTGMPIKLN